MEVTQIPFAKQIGIEYKNEHTLKLEPADSVQNHIQSIHASAQFALAETQSGLTLQLTFPELKNKVVAMLRSSSVKFKRPATTTLSAHAHIDTDIKEKFLTQFTKKERASITVDVELRDENNVVTMIGSYEWFVHKL